MNILFVNYGDFTTNSLNHIAGFANRLSAAGHACAVAVPQGKETVAVIPGPCFAAATYGEALDRPGLFPDGRAADLIHAWTPRECVRKFVLAYQRAARARLVVHLEDNEEFLLSAWLGRPISELVTLSETELAEHSGAVALSHPRRYRHFLRAAEGVTIIVGSLRQFAPRGTPCLLLPPGLDFGLYHPSEPDPGLRRELGLREGERAVVFTGSNTFANEPEMRELYDAVALLNRRGFATRLVRTGLNSPSFSAATPAADKEFVLDLGFVDKARLPGLLALADVLVQPGRPGPFNDFRLPSKLPEFLSVGKPVVLPASNVGAELRDGEDALILRTGGPEEIADACRRIFSDPDLAGRLSRNSVAFARRRFDLDANARALAEFYTEVCARPIRAGSTASLAGEETEISLSLRSLAAEAGDPETAALAADLAVLVAALERQEAALGERRRLERERDEWQRHYKLAQQHQANIAKQLKLTDQHAKNLNRQLVQIRGQIQRLIDKFAANEKALEGARTEQARLAGKCDELGQTVAAREAKIRAMAESASWRLTQPLRFLRRRLLDPRRRAPQSPEPPENAAAPEPPPLSISASVDNPQSWTLPPRKTLIRGWCFADDGRKLTSVRAVLPGRTVAGDYGFKRLDVLASTRGKPQTEYCGWQFEIDLAPADTGLDLEVADESGAWHPFFHTALRIGEGLGPLDLTSYEQWIDVYEGRNGDAPPIPADQAFVHRPLISVLLPVYNTDERWLRRAIDSVRSQTYPYWELCIADDASTAHPIRPLLEEAARQDRRIKVVFRERNGHISEASNSALALSKGEFVALLDHDDELSPDALYEVAAALDSRPDADYLYSDEDKIDENGRRHRPYFKPDWMPDLFLGQNYTSHFSVYRASLVAAVGGFRIGYEGSQDWDLTLRVVEKAKPGCIVHIPRVLYHWRSIPGSTALQLAEKDYPVESARRALSDHFARTGRKVELAPVPGDHWRIKYLLPADPPLVSLVIPTRNGLPFLRRCVDSLLEKTTYPNFEILVVDNGSDDPEALEYLRTLAGGAHSLLRPGRSARVLRHDGPFNYSAINNLGVRGARGSVIGLLNNDLEAINGDWLDEMTTQALRPEIGCVGAMLYYPNDTIQHAGTVLGVGGVAGHAFRDFPRGTEGAFNRARLAQNYSAVTAACLVVRKSVYEQVGGLDEKELAVAFNDVDFCLKVRAAGYRNLWTPFAEFYHHESASRGVDDTEEKAGRFQSEVETMLRRWGPLLEQDPAYNPNLTLELNDFSLASPPRPAVPA